MPVYETINDTKHRWDRNRNFYSILQKYKFDPPDSGKHDVGPAGANKIWTSTIIYLKSPILTSGDIDKIISTNGLRIYPPFPLNLQAATTHLFKDVKIPFGIKSIAEHLPIPDNVITGLNTAMTINESRACHGLRLDLRNGIEIEVPLSFFLRAARQYSKQWWLSSPRDPFDFGVRFEIDLDEKFSPSTRIHGDQKERPNWRGASAMQGLIGFEVPINSSSWEHVENCMKRGNGVDVVLDYFFDAVSSFMEFSDELCILNLALMFEVGENKVRIMDGKKAERRNEWLLKKPALATDKLNSIFRKIITDRDHIAHGRYPRSSNRRPRDIVDYLEASAEFIEKYLARAGQHGWPAATAIEI